MVGFPAVEVTCIGAGGGSIARVDAAGLLSVGPESAGAEPGPAAYGRGGLKPTVTDAALALGYLDPQHFLGGRKTLDAEAARTALDREVGGRMVGAIEDVTVKRGVDPSSAVLIGGGGSAGFNVVAIARRLGCARIVIPSTGATLSAAGALLSNLTDEYRTLSPTLSSDFSIEAINRVLAELEQRCHAFAAGPGAGSRGSTIKFAVEARYLGQAWDIQVPLPPSPRFDAAAVAELTRMFHATHQELFAVSDPDSAIEFLTWSARIECRLRESSDAAPKLRFEEQWRPSRRNVYFSGHGWLDAEVRGFSSLHAPLHGPAIVESPFTTVVLPPGSAARSSAIGSLVVHAFAEAGT
jgi:N-methylhydantoinase A